MDNQPIRKTITFWRSMTSQLSIVSHLPHQQNSLDISRSMLLNLVSAPSLTSNYCSTWLRWWISIQRWLWHTMWQMSNLLILFSWISSKLCEIHCLICSNRQKTSIEVQFLTVLSLFHFGFSTQFAFDLSCSVLCQARKFSIISQIIFFLSHRYRR